jgi:hypothetical protein
MSQIATSSRRVFADLVEFREDRGRSKSATLTLDAEIGQQSHF